MKTHLTVAAIVLLMGLLAVFADEPVARRLSYESVNGARQRECAERRADTFAALDPEARSCVTPESR